MCSCECVHLLHGSFLSNYVCMYVCMYVVVVPIIATISFPLLLLPNNTCIPTLLVSLSPSQGGSWRCILPVRMVPFTLIFSIFFTFLFSFIIFPLLPTPLRFFFNEFAGRTLLEGIFLLVSISFNLFCTHFLFACGDVSRAGSSALYWWLS